jgi:hypothetical protein
MNRAKERTGVVMNDRNDGVQAALIDSTLCRPWNVAWLTSFLQRLATAARQKGRGVLSTILTRVAFAAVVLEAPRLNRLSQQQKQRGHLPMVR